MNGATRFRFEDPQFIGHGFEKSIVREQAFDGCARYDFLQALHVHSTIAVVAVFTLPGAELRTIGVPAVFSAGHVR